MRVSCLGCGRVAARQEQVMGSCEPGNEHSDFYNIIYNKPTRCNSGNIVFIKNYKYALHVSDALCVHLQEHYKL